MHAETVVTDVLVPGRSHAVSESGQLALSGSSIQRVQAAAEYYFDNQAAFHDAAGVIHFEGGWAKAAGGIAKPPEEFREGRLMNELAGELGVPAMFRSEGIESTSTMDNMLKARQRFAGVSRLAIVTQLSQAGRLLYCGSKALPGIELSIIEAPGEENPEILQDEARLLKQSRILYGWARGPRTLALADRLGTIAGNLAGLKPAGKYASAA